MLRTLLSIDNDFFPWFPNPREKITILNSNGKPVSVTSQLVFDWGHSEGSNLFFGPMWAIRGISFAMMGLDLEDTYNVRADKGCVTHEQLVAALLARYKIRGVAACDSHVGALADTIERQRTYAEIVNFDAHHDLGYNSNPNGNAKASCEDWLYHALNSNWAYVVTVVYPDWREERRPGPWANKFVSSGRLRYMSWSQWLLYTARQSLTGKEAADVFTCRSGAWSPPWLDKPWLAMIDTLGKGNARWVWPDDSAEPREWDSQAERQRAREGADARATLLDRLPQLEQAQAKWQALA